MAEQLQQGLGLVRTVMAVPPTTRTDGTPLAGSEIQHYNWYIAFNGGPEQLIGTPQIVAGAFTDQFDVDSQTPGMYEFRYSTTDSINQEGPKSPVLAIEILAPLAPPNPPTVS